MADRHDRFFDSLSRRLKGVAVTWRAETWFRREPEDVYKTLVADLSQTLVPTTIMGVTTIGVDLFAWLSSKSSMLLLAASIGGLASVAKIVLILVQLRRGVRDDMCIREARRWEASHYAATTLVALSVGMATFVIFRRSDVQLHLLATGPFRLLRGHRRADSHPSSDGYPRIDSCGGSGHCRCRIVERFAAQNYRGDIHYLLTRRL